MSAGGNLFASQEHVVAVRVPRVVGARHGVEGPAQWRGKRTKRKEKEKERERKKRKETNNGVGRKERKGKRKKEKKRNKQRS